MSRHYVRNEPIDVLFEGGESLVLLPPDRVVRLSAIATTLYEATATSTSTNDLAALVVARHGTPPDGGMGAALQRILDDLVDGGVLGLSEGG